MVKMSKRMRQRARRAKANKARAAAPPQEKGKAPKPPEVKPSPALSAPEAKATMTPKYSPVGPKKYRIKGVLLEKITRDGAKERCAKVRLPWRPRPLRIPLRHIDREATEISQAGDMGVLVVVCWYMDRRGVMPLVHGDEVEVVQDFELDLGLGEALPYARAQAVIAHPPIHKDSANPVKLVKPGDPEWVEIQAVAAEDVATTTVSA